MRLKLFIWKDVLTDYTSGVIFALAENVESARATVIESCLDEDWAHDRLRQEMSADPEVHESPYGFFIWGGS